MGIHFFNCDTVIPQNPLSYKALESIKMEEKLIMNYELCIMHYELNSPSKQKIEHFL